MSAGRTIPASRLWVELLFIAKFAQAAPANLPTTLPVLVGLNLL
jgi:hypothetical protein